MLAAPLATVWFFAVALAALDGRRRWVGWAAVAAVAANLLLLAVLGALVLAALRRLGR